MELNGADDEKISKPKLPNWRNPVRLLEVLRANALFGLIMCYFYFCDYHKGLPPGAFAFGFGDLRCGLLRACPTIERDGKAKQVVVL